MKKIYNLHKSGRVFHRMFLLLFTASLFMGKLSAQQYVNGNLNTGPTSSNGTAAPAGYTWSEVQAGNVNAGFGANITAGLTIADDFTVPAGPSWNITKVTFYAYSTGWATNTSPFNDTRIQIYNTNPSIGTPVPIYGDLTTNRFSASSTASMYRIFNATPGNTRQIFKIEANVSLTLAPGTYWIEWQHGLTGATSNFSPASTVVGTVTQPGNNALQRTIATNAWVQLLDGANVQDMPFVIDYTTGACAGTPAPGNTIASAATVCPGIPVNLSLQNSTSGSGVTYQWASASAVGGPYTPIAGATSSTYSTTIAATTFFQCAVTCSGNTGTSTPVQVAQTPPSGCYCTAGSPDVTFEKISRVQYNTINNPSTSTAGYENFTNISTTVVQQSTLPITITISNAFATDQSIVWIDFNQNGNFTDPGERVFISAAGVGPHTGNITIPATSLLGPTRMRIRMHDSGLGPNATPCGNSSYGQVEDYTVNITPCIPVTMSNPANATISCGGDATFTVTATGSGPTYQWQQRTSPTATWTNVTNVAPFSGATTNTLTISSAPVSMNGYQYRVVFTGYCRSTDFTQPATLTVNPLVANVNPASANICNGSTQQLTITNITSPIPASTVVNSGAISVAIPDNNPAGVTHSLNVAGIPATAIVTGISVKLNMTHTWDGDMVFALKSPSGAIINLDYYLTGTGGAGVTTGFVNTVISSAGTAALNTGTNPYTGTFRADLAAGTANPPSGPTGFTPTTTSWATFMSSGSPNGAWTLGMYDGGGGDLGTLTSWEITVNYIAGIPATGVWTGPAGTMFNDAGMTSPYTGNAVNSIYVHPTVTANYTVVVTTPVCVSGPTTIPVTVSNPIGTVTAPANATICANGSTSFTVAAASGNPINYQWQVSTDAGATWTNIANNSIYGGATTATLTLNGVPVTYNNYRYRAVLSVTACASTVNSAAATLTVNPLPVVVINAGPYTSLYPGITTTLTAAVSPNAAASYQWYINGVAIPGATAATYVVDVDHLGDYSVSVVDVNGCGGASPNSISITAQPSDVLFIFPSPNTGQFQVRYQSLAGNVVPRMVTVYDSKGARVFTKQYSIGTPYGRMDVDMRNHGRGIYRVELGDLNGKRIKTGNVLIL